MKILSAIASALLVAISYPVVAHHSFAIYDIDNKISRTGTLTKLEFSNPHIKMGLEVVNEDGSKETWTIESMNPSRWDSRELPRDLAEVGETVTILGWPARSGKNDMTISAMTTARGTTIIQDEVGQPGVRDIVPPPTVKRK